jgi:hypothetical protein
LELVQAVPVSVADIRAIRTSKYDDVITLASQLGPDEALWVLTMPRIRPVYDRGFHFGSHRFSFEKRPTNTTKHTVPGNVKFIVPITGAKAYNIKRALLRRIQARGLQDRIQVTVRARKILLTRADTIL